VTDGWLAGKVLLSSAERAPYRVEGEVVRALATASDTEGQDEL
jgi:hypothetical protein